MLSKEEILSCSDVKIETVHVPEWGGDICVKTITAQEQDEWSVLVSEQRGIKKINAQASFLVMCLCDESGNLIFTKEDIESLGKKSAGAMNRIFNVASRLNGLSKDDLKEIEKNSETT